MRSTFQKLTHDLRQPLSAIDTSAYFLEMILPEGDGLVRKHLENIRQQVLMASQLLNECDEKDQETRPLTKSASSSVTN